MPFGEGGKYDAECEEVFKKLDPDAVLLVVLNGPKGQGFSMTSKAFGPMVILPELLRRIADEIDKSFHAA